MNETRFVLDASALLCVFFQEPGADRVEAVFDRAVISAINYAEAVAKLADQGAPMNTLARDLADLDLDIVPVDRALADAAALIGSGPSRSGLAIGDRFCFALAKRLGGTVLTVDRGWPRIGERVGVTVEVLRAAED